MNSSLERSVGVGGAILLGLGSMVGTGVFVSLGVAAGVTGPSVVLAVLIAALVAACNAMSSAQLAAAHPVSGGTYEYGYRFLTPVLGFVAGWMFLVAKSASAATAAIGFGGYVLSAFGVGDELVRRLVPALVVALVTLVAAAGLKRSTRVNAIIVSVTLASLAFLIVVAAPRFSASAFRPFFQPVSERTGFSALVFAAALSFVAFTGYGRIATLGEEIRDPERNIPKAILATVVITAALYVLVAGSGVSVLGSGGLAAATESTGAPLEVVAADLTGTVGRTILTVGAAVALLGVLLNLVLGLSRVLLAMGRRRDMPSIVSRVADGTPRVAVIIMGVVVAAISLVGDIRLTWSFSAITVLTYYSLTNLSALRLQPADRLYPRWISALGLIGCVSLAVFIDTEIAIVWGIVLAIGLAWHGVARRIGRARGAEPTA